MLTGVFLFWQLVEPENTLKIIKEEENPVIHKMAGLFAKMDINQVLSDELKVQKWQVDAAVKLIDEGNTIPFIARYRKEVTGALNDEVLRNLFERLTYLRGLEERKEAVLASIEEQGKLTDELKAKIVAAQTLVAVEDLYRPYKPKRKTRLRLPRKKDWSRLPILSIFR